MGNPRIGARMDHKVSVFFLIAGFVIFMTHFRQANAEESHAGLNAEVLYSEAVIALSRSQTDEALKRLDELLQEQPQNIEALELQALTLKNKGEIQKAIDNYEKLLTLKKGAETGAYHFELGTLYYNQKKTPEAKGHLEEALRHKFNALVCRFYLGNITFGEGNLRYAEHYFRRVKAEAPDGEMKLVAEYYLGIIELKSGYPLGGTRDLGLAKKLAETMPDNPNAKQIGASSAQVLKPFESGSWFGNVAVIAGYDSNISEIPTNLTSVEQGSNRATTKLSTSGGIGRMSAPIEDFQYVADYRFSYNHDFNSQTKTFEFFSNDASVYLNYKPLSLLNGGIKLEGNLLFENLPTADTSGSSSPDYVLTRYDMGGEMGPFVRYQPTRQLNLEGDLFYKPQKFYTDDTLSGPTYFGRVIAKSDLYLQYFNPTLTVSYETYRPSNLDFRANSWDFALADLMKVTPRDQVTATLDFLTSQYPTNFAGRADRNFSLGLSAAHVLNPHWALMANVSYLVNHSTEADLYSYNRFQGGIGVNWSL